VEALPWVSECVSLDQCGEGAVEGRGKEGSPANFFLFHSLTVVSNINKKLHLKNQQDLCLCN